MTHRPWYTLRWAAVLLVAVAAASGTAFAVTDAAALPVGAVFVALLVASGLSTLFRYADVAAVVLGSAAYAVLEQHRGRAGDVSWAAATGILLIALVAVRLLNRRVRAAERRAWQAQETIGELARTDPASELLKPTYAQQALEEEVHRARRIDVPVTLVLVAADPAPDHDVEAPHSEEAEAAMVGTVLRKSLRSIDRGARLGPALYGAILPSTSAQGGAVVAERISLLSEREGGRSLRCAVATFPDHAASPQELLDEAQAALRLARTADLAVITPTMLYQLGVAT